MMLRDKADLVFDSWRAGTTVGARGASGGERSVIFRAGEFTIDLLVAGPNRPAAIYGQVICDSGPAPVANAKVRFGQASARPGALGQFSLPVESRVARSIEIRISTPKKRIRCSLDLLN